MNFEFNPPEVNVESYSYCELTFDDGRVVKYGQGETAEEVGGSVLTTLPRVNLEYNSPLINGRFPENGAFASITYSLLDDNNQAHPVTINKVFRPYGCVLIILKGQYELGSEMHWASCKIDCSEERLYCSVINLGSSEDESSSLEIQRHLSNQEDTRCGHFKVLPHELQINGSNYCISPSDLLSSMRRNYVDNMTRSVSEFMNFSLARNGSKFYIGQYVR